MTTWTDQSTIESGWQSPTINTATTILYNDNVPYNADYLTYNGYYITTQTDWSSDVIQETAWSA